jgi:hypothetical protein
VSRKLVFLGVGACLVAGTFFWFEERGKAEREARAHERVTEDLEGMVSRRVVAAAAGRVQPDAGWKRPFWWYSVVRKRDRVDEAEARRRRAMDAAEAVRASFLALVRRLGTEVEAGDGERVEATLREAQEAFPSDAEGLRLALRSGAQDDEASREALARARDRLPSGPETDALLATVARGVRAREERSWAAALEIARKAARSVEEETSVDFDGAYEERHRVVAAEHAPFVEGVGRVARAALGHDLTAAQEGLAVLPVVRGRDTKEAVSALRAAVETVRRKLWTFTYEVLAEVTRELRAGDAGAARRAIERARSRFRVRSPALGHALRVVEAAEQRQPSDAARAADDLRVVLPDAEAGRATALGEAGRAYRDRREGPLRALGASLRVAFEAGDFTRAAGLVTEVREVVGDGDEKYLSALRAAVEAAAADDVWRPASLPEPVSASLRAATFPFRDLATAFEAGRKRRLESIVEDLRPSLEGVRAALAKEKAAPGADPRLEGGVVVWNEAGGLHDAQAGLPAAQRPTTLSAVRWVLYVHDRSETVARYSGVLQAHPLTQEHVKVAVYDWKARRLVGVRTVSGPTPPTTRYFRGGVETVPYDGRAKVGTWIAALLPK